MAAPAIPAGYGPLRYTAELTLESLSTFELVAELSLATIGFAGVATAFGGRKREYGELERQRLVGLMRLAGSSLAAALLFQVLTAARVPLETAVMWTAVPSLVATVLGAATGIPPLYRSTKNSDSETTVLAVLVILAIRTVEAFFLCGALVLEDGVWALLAALSLQLGTAVLLFARLLVRVN